jgi:hypothetical protein
LRIADDMVSRLLRDRWWRSLGLVVLFAVQAARADAGSLTLAWDASLSPDVAGYTIAYGTTPGHYTQWVDVGNATVYTINGLNNGVYYLAVRAYTTQRITSSYSNEVVATVGISNTCTTPDPFATMGGGICYNGGWLPPGMPLPSASPAPAPAPAPTAPATVSVQGCSTPDPFAAMGGGTCYNGGWLPPGMPVPAGGTAPAPSPTPAPSPSPTPVTQGCTSADPFAAMGGGTCYNGGWLPPGMPVPGGTGSTTSTPPPTTQPPPITQGCNTSDPFVILGGGVCYLGGWLPPGSRVSLKGVMHVIDPATDEWVIELANGTVVTSPTPLLPGQIVDGANVKVEGMTMPSPSSSTGVIIIQILSFEILP